MKILNDIACNLNWIHFELNWIQVIKFTSNTLNQIQNQLRRNRMQIGAKGVENMLMTMVFCFN